MIKKDKELIGYALIFREKNEEGDGHSHGMASTYPDIINKLMLGFHAGVFTNYDAELLQAIANEVTLKVFGPPANEYSKDEEKENEQGGKEPRIQKSEESPDRDS